MSSHCHLQVSAAFWTSPRHARWTSRGQACRKPVEHGWNVVLCDSPHWFNFLAESGIIRNRLYGPWTLVIVRFFVPSFCLGSLVFIPAILCQAVTLFLLQKWPSTINKVSWIYSLWACGWFVPLLGIVTQVESSEHLGLYWGSLRSR
jgi:hypothetical protein